MARTTVASVQAVLDTSLTDIQVSAFLEDASSWVTDFLGSESLSTGRLTAIEKYLAAFYATSREPLLARQALDDVSETYLREENPYLKLAIANDPTGIVSGTFLEQDEGVPFKYRVGVYDPD